MAVEQADAWTAAAAFGSVVIGGVTGWLGWLGARRKHSEEVAALAASSLNEKDSSAWRRMTEMLTVQGEEMARVRADRDELEQKVDALEAKVDALVEIVRQKDDQISVLRARVNHLEGRMS